MASEVYRQRGVQRGFLYVVIGLMALFGVPMWIGALVSGEGGLAIFMTMWVGILAFNGYRFLGGPHQIVVTADCVRFVGWRTREVPWTALRSIRSPWYDLNRMAWRWEWDGGGLTILGSFERQHQLLRSIEDRAPQVDIEV
jgi:hypothetical protein